MRHAPWTDAELVQLTRAGSRDAYGEIVRRHTTLVCAAIRTVVRDSYLIEELAQETFLTGFLSLGALQNPERLAPWLYGIAKRKALHAVSRRRAYEDLPESLLADTLTPEEALLREEARRAVRDAVAALSEKNRVCVEMYYFDEMTLSEIARACSLPSSTVKSRLHEARQKLKGALSYMHDYTTPMMPEAVSTPEKAIREKMRDMHILRRLCGRESEEAKALSREAEALLDAAPDGEEKHRAILAFYTNSPWGEKYKEYVETTAPGRVRAVEQLGEMWKLLGRGEEAIRVVNKAEEDAAVREAPEFAQLLFWRGREKARLGDIAGAEVDFRAAEQVAEAQDIYRALSRTAVRSIALLRENADSVEGCLHVTAERYGRHGAGMYFLSQPGFNERSVLWHLHRYESMFYYISRADDTFYDASMAEGETRTSKATGCTLTLLSRGETVTVPAGTFHSCLHVRTSDGDMRADAWYAPDVGLLRTVVSDTAGEETYWLTEYEIRGGDGYLPLAEGNRWKYENPALPPYLFSHFESVIDYADGVVANACRYCLVAMRKNYAELYPPDGTLLLEQCDELCTKWKTGEALEILREAVRVNSAAYTTAVALGGIDYLTRFCEAEKKKCRICPSSFNAGSVSLHGTHILASESDISFGPYRYGTRHEENRIFGTKLIRWLTDVAGCLFACRWEVGFTESRPIEVYGCRGKLTLRVEDGGAVTVPAGTFSETLKVTLDAVSDAVAAGETGYFGNGHRHVWAGVKEYYFVRGVGIVLLVCRWGDSLDARCELVSYSCPAADDSYLPIQIGNRWDYAEATLTREGYRACRSLRIVGGKENRFTYTDSQEFWYLGTEEQYEEAKKTGF